MREEPIEIGSKLPAGKVRGELFYAWVTVFASAGVFFLTGHFQYTFGVFVKPLIDHFGWSRAAVSTIVSIRNLVTALLSPIAGTLADRYGVQRLILVGVIVCGLGYILAARATSLWQLCLFLGGFVGICNGITFAPVMAMVTKWFGNKSALANGVTSSGLSISQILLPPVAAFLIGGYGWGITFIILGGAAWLFGTLSWRFIKNPPPDTRREAGELLLAKNGAQASKSGASNDYTLREALRSLSFWIIFFVFVVDAICFQMVVIHIVVAAVGFGAAVGAAAIILTIIGITNTLGRLSISGLADKIGGRMVLTLSLALQAGALLVLAQARDLRTFYIAGAFFGLLYGSVMPIVPSLAGNFFGTRFMGAIFGTLNIGYLGGAAIGPLVAGYVFDITGGYYWAFVIAAVLAASAFILCLLLKQPPRKVAAA